MVTEVYDGKKLSLKEEPEYKQPVCTGQLRICFKMTVEKQKA